MYKKIGFADMAPRFRQMPTSSYQAITPILLIRKMIKMMVMVMLMVMVMVMD